MSATIVIREAVTDDVAAMQTVETAASSRFREIDDPRISQRADDPPYSSDALVRAISEQRAWVALDDDGSVIGFAVAWTFDGEGHLDEVTVTPEHGRRGVGRALIEQVVAWAAQRDLPSVTLTTYRDVPWNAPYYEQLGFRVVSALTPALQRLLDGQAAWGLDPSLRVVMRRSTDGPSIVTQ